MKKFYMFVAVSSFIVYAMAREKIPFSEVFFTYSSNYDNFQKAFDDRFGSRDDVWIVLGNRGINDYYRERFSKNWIYWDDYSSSDNLGITGDYLNTENWIEISKKLPKKVSYIAADFNDLVNSSKRNSVIIASKNILKEGGIFCIEDEFDNRTKKFDHFTAEDLSKLSNEFKIDYAYWDGYISALPYTCDQSINVKTEMYKGLETMILRLAAANMEEKRKILPHITPRLYLNTLRVKKSLISRLIRDIISSNTLSQMIKRYEDANSDVNNIRLQIDKTNTNIEEIKKEIAKYEKLIKFSRNVSNRFSRFSKKFNQVSKNARAISRQMDLLKTAKKSESSSIMDKFSNVIGKGKEEVSNTEEKLSKKKIELEESQEKLEELNRDLDTITDEIKNIEERIMKYNDACFAKFEKDNYLKKYLTYKRTKLPQIINDNKLSNIEFWDDYDNKAFFHIESISDLEILAGELEKSWSPEVITQNKVSLEDIKSQADKNLNEKTKVIILFTKK